MTAPVVVGIDDIEHSAHAAALAALEAELREAPLWVGHAYQWVPPVAAGVMPGGDTPEGAVRDAATELLAAAVQKIHAGHPELDIHSYAMSGQAGTCLADLAKTASLLVVGGRGRGGFAGLTLGSVALRALAHARCPVLVARGEPRPATGRLLLGVDLEEPVGEQTLFDFAFEEAARHGAALDVLHAWEDPGYLYPPVGFSEHLPNRPLEAANAERQRRLDGLLAHWRNTYPGTTVSSQVLTGSPIRRLVEASSQADLLIIGGRLHRDQEGMRLGGLAHAVLHHSQCPVIVVPQP